MLLVYGTYHWFPKQTAFRHDFCRACSSPTVSVRVHTTDVFHIFWIPVLPLGRWGRWFCGVCGNKPHAVTRTRRPFKALGILLLLLMGLAFWLMPVDPGDEAMTWFFRLASPAGMIALVVSIVRQPTEPSLKQQLAGVEPYTGQQCLLCEGPMTFEEAATCSRCKSKHLPLKQRQGSA